MFFTQLHTYHIEPSPTSDRFLVVDENGDPWACLDTREQCQRQIEFLLNPFGQEAAE